MNPVSTRMRNGYHVTTTQAGPNRFETRVTDPNGAWVCSHMTHSPRYAAQWHKYEKHRYDNQELKPNHPVISIGFAPQPRRNDASSNVDG